MIKNKLFTTSILVAATTATPFLGCGTNASSNQGGTTSSSGGSSFPSSSSSGAGNEASSGSSSGSSSGGSSDAGMCTPPSSVPNTSLPTYAPVVQMTNACTSMQISGFLSSCVAQGASGSGCSSWASSNGTCAACVVQGTEAGATETGAILFNANGNPVSANVPGCIALEDSSGGPMCAAVLEPLMQCVALACASCTSQSAFSACEAATKASNGACGTYASAAQSPCANYVGTNGVGVTKCGYGTGNELADVLNVVCGAGP